MILADKIIKQRKKLQITQEELAEKMNVSRQAVSKWESAQAVPDLERILRLAELFGVTTDYLLKDSEETEVYSDSRSDGDFRSVTISEAYSYLSFRSSAALRIAFGVFLCIISVIPLILLCGISESHPFVLPEKTAVPIGLTFMFLCVASAVIIFISVGLRNEPWEFLEQDPFEIAYGVEGMVKERLRAFKKTYAICNMSGAFLCIISPVPLLIGAFFENGLLLILLTCILIFTVSAAVFLFVYAGVRRAAADKLLKEGDFKQRKSKSKKRDALESIYWAVVTAVYLAWSFITFEWGITWVVWPVAAALSAVIDGICRLNDD